MGSRLTIMTAVFVMFAVSRAEGQVNFGLKAGATSTSFYGSDAGEVVTRGSVAGGAFLKLNSGGIFAIQPELLLVNKGATNYNSANNIKQELFIQYLEIPMLLKVQIPLAERIFPHAMVGPYYSWKLKNTYRAYEIDRDVVYENQDLSVRDADFGFLFGGGIDIQGDLVFFTADVRYSFGLPNLDMGSPDRVGWNLKNSGFMMTGGLGIRLFN